MPKRKYVGRPNVKDKAKQYGTSVNQEKSMVVFMFGTSKAPKGVSSKARKTALNATFANARKANRKGGKRG